MNMVDFTQYKGQGAEGKPPAKGCTLLLHGLHPDMPPWDEHKGLAKQPPLQASLHCRRCKVEAAICGQNMENPGPSVIPIAPHQLFPGDWAESGPVAQGNSHSDQGFVNWLPKLNNIPRLPVLVLSSLPPGRGVSLPYPFQNMPI